MNTRDKVHALVAKKLGLSDPAFVTDSATFESLGGDALDIVEISVEIEDEFNVQIDDNDLDRVDTIGDLVAVVERVTAP